MFNSTVCAFAPHRLRWISEFHRKKAAACRIFPGKSRKKSGAFAPTLKMFKHFDWISSKSTCICQNLFESVQMCLNVCGLWCEGFAQRRNRADRNEFRIRNELKWIFRRFPKYSLIQLSRAVELNWIELNKQWIIIQCLFTIFGPTELNWIELNNHWIIIQCLFTVLDRLNWIELWIYSLIHLFNKIHFAP